jgi:hypothetical protein
LALPASNFISQLFSKSKLPNFRFPETKQPFEGSNDLILKGMQWLYSLANDHAQELVFVPAVEVRFRVFQPMDAILDALRVGQPLNRLKMSRVVSYFLVCLESLEVKSWFSGFGGFRKCWGVW